MDNLPPQVAGFQDVCGWIFRVSKFCGAFPYSVLPSGLHKSYPSLLLSFLLAGATIWTGSYYWNEHSRMVIMANQNVFTSHFLLIPRLTLVLLTPVSTGWLFFKCERLRKVIGALSGVESTTSHIPKVFKLPLIVVFLLSIGTGLNGYLHYSEAFTQRPAIFAIYHIYFSLGILLVLQFCSFLETLRGLYSYLIQSLDAQNAERWTQCHEVLGSCCILLSDCYAPPLILFFLCMYSLCVVQVYGIVIKIKRNDPEGIYYFLYWVILELYMVWFVLFNCRDALVKAQEFDKLLYRMTINDDSKALLRNKRILIHFKGKRKEQFSAMGLFNFDYPLICSMVSSATTYIVIFVQFTY